jgi:outer membrane protein OmpA-like peptidoglycan-associated protein
MKKLMFALALAGLATGAMAQENEIPTKKYSVATNSFWSNWYVQVGGEFNAAYTNQEKLGNKNPFSVDRGTFGFEAAVGKWFTPVIGLRTKFQGIWAKAVNDGDDHHSYKYWTIHEDVMFNLSNAFCGYNEKRFWNIAPYVGIGYINRMEASDAADRNSEYREPTYNVGIYNSFRINRRLAAYLDVWGMAMEGSLDAFNSYKNQGENDWHAHKKTESRYWDKLVGVSVGLNINLGKTIGWNKVPDVDALMAMNKEQLDALNNSLKEQQDENARLRNLLANQKPGETKTVKEFATTPVSVFFNINRTKIASRKDLVNVKELAEYAKANNKKLVVTGYADSKTGTAAINQRLSEGRAKAVANELVKMGVSRDNIVVESKGGVNDIAPFSYNRRAIVKLQ